MAYQTLRVNVDMLKLIQLGLSFTDGKGNWANGCTCWQFNFKFDTDADIHAHDSIELLKTSGIDFEKFQKHGIDVPHFGELMMMSGLVLNDDVKWVSFHSSYDFGYLLKTLSCQELPLEEVQFMELLHTYFPYIYDVKYMMTMVEGGMHGGLSALGDTLQVERIGPMHQAGSDSLLTAQTFFALIEKHFKGECDDSKFRGELFGLGTNHTSRKSRPYMGTGAATGSGYANSAAGYGGGGYGMNGPPPSMHHSASNQGLSGAGYGFEGMEGATQEGY
jgi:CCR4-NOT transcription complex subunit 7/8